MRSPGLRATLGRARSFLSRLRWALIPIAALVAVIAFQAFQVLQAPAVPAAPELSTPIDTPVDAPANDPLTAPDNGTDNGTDPLTDITPDQGAGVAAAVDTTDTDTRISFWQDRLRETPRSDTAWTYLGELFDLKARQTGDLSNFTAARDAFTTAIEISPSSPTARLGLARISITLHDFEAALVAATQVLEEFPSANGAVAIIFDAAYELGDLDIARTALDRLKARPTSPAVLTREARLAYVTGDSATAVRLSAEAATLAESRGDSPSSIAFYRQVAGEHALLAGDFAAADLAYSAALDELPGYSLAIAGRGRAAIARGDYPAAIDYLATATAAVPRPDHVALLGDLYAVTGQTDLAEEQYATVRFIHDLAASNGAQVYDREYTLFLADHRQDVEQALQSAQAEAEVRQDVFGYDNLAWALHANGREEEALTAIRGALALGTVDAKILLHAGLIELANGLSSEGKAHLQQALDLNPAMSAIVLDQARTALE